MGTAVMKSVAPHAYAAQQTANQLADAEFRRQIMATRPPPPPDLTSQIVQAARRAEMDRLKVGRTLASSFRAANRTLYGG